MVTLDQTAVPATITINPSAYAVADIFDGTFQWAIDATEATSGTTISAIYFELTISGFKCEKAVLGLDYSVGGSLVSTIADGSQYNQLYRSGLF